MQLLQFILSCNVAQNVCKAVMCHQYTIAHSRSTQRHAVKLTVNSQINFEGLLSLYNIK